MMTYTSYRLTKKNTHVLPNKARYQILKMAFPDWQAVVNTAITIFPRVNKTLRVERAFAEESGRDWRVCCPNIHTGHRMPEPTQGRNQGRTCSSSCMMHHHGPIQDGMAAAGIPFKSSIDTTNSLAKSGVEN